MIRAGIGAVVVVAAALLTLKRGTPPTHELAATTKPTAATAKLRILVEPFGEISIDGRVVGVCSGTGAVDVVVEPGLRELTVQAPGRHDHVSKLRFLPRETRAVTVRMDPIRAHVVQSPSIRTLRPFDVARGALASGDATIASARRSVGVPSAEPAPAAFADVYRLEPAPGVKNFVSVNSLNAHVAARIYGRNGRVLAEDKGAQWTGRLTFVPEAGEDLCLVIENAASEKAVRMDIVRYVVVYRL